MLELPTDYQKFIHSSRYARFRDDLGRRETWGETVTRFFDYFQSSLEEKHSYKPSQTLVSELKDAVSGLHVMPSMRALMTAGEAARRESLAIYNCAFLPIDSIRAFGETLYILMCFHPDTLVTTRKGDKKISEIVIGDEVLSVDESTGRAVWKKVTSQVQTPSSAKPKVEITLETGKKIRCTTDHKWLTSNRGWVEAGSLTLEDDLLSPRWEIYKVTNTLNGKSYVGLTTKGAKVRFAEHVDGAKKGTGSWKFASALRKHDLASWSVEVVDFAFSKEEAIQKEREWIASLDTFRTGYNSTLGGEGAEGYRWRNDQKLHASENSYERTPDHREKQREVLISNREKINLTRKTDAYREAQRLRNLGENNPRFGKKHSTEWKEKASLAMKGERNPFYGRTHSEEAKARIREKVAGTRDGENNSFFGKKHSEETKAKMKASWAAKKESRA